VVSAYTLAARAAQSPEQLGGTVAVDLVRAPVRGDEAQALQVGGGEAVPAGEQADAAAQGVAGHTHPGRQDSDRER
jgi:hypothetical protein